MPARVPMFTAAAAGRADAVTAFRREMKFAFDRADVKKLLTVLTMNTTPIAFGDGPVSHVHSLYFDDDRLRSLRESVDGADPRVKLRMRWYDAPLPAGDVYFEIKRRSGAYIRKNRVPLRLSEPASTLSAAALVDGLTAALPDEAAAWLSVRRQPTAIIAYRRRHFRDRESGIRITVDDDIRGYDQVGAMTLRPRFATPVHDLVVVEVKAASIDEPHVRRLLYPLKPRLTRSSKYVQCCQQMGWCSTID